MMVPGTTRRERMAWPGTAEGVSMSPGRIGPLAAVALTGTMPMTASGIF